MTEDDRSGTYSYDPGDFRSLRTPRNAGGSTGVVFDAVEELIGLGDACVEPVEYFVAGDVGESVVVAELVEVSGDFPSFVAAAEAYDLGGFADHGVDGVVDFLSAFG